MKFLTCRFLVNGISDPRRVLLYGLSERVNNKFKYKHASRGKEVRAHIKKFKSWFPVKKETLDTNWDILRRIYVTQPTRQPTMSFATLYSCACVVASYIEQMCHPMNPIGYGRIGDVTSEARS